MDYFPLESSKDILSIDEIKEKVLINYNLNVLNIENIKYKDTSKPRAVFKVSTDRGVKCLKKVYYDEPTLLFIYSVIEWLNFKGVICPRFISTKKGLKYVRYKNSLYLLTDWIEGRKCDYDNIEDLKLASENLARIHLYSYMFSPIEGSRIPKSESDFVQSLNKHFLQLLELSNKAFILKDKFSRLFLDNFDYNIEKAQESVYLISLIDFSRDFGDRVSKKAICHLDYVNKNIIITPENKLVVIDFDRTAIDMPLHDLIYYFRRILKRENTSWNFEIFKTAIESYERVRKMSYSEHVALLAALMFPHKFWKVSRDYYRNRKECNRDAFITILKKISAQQEKHDLFCNQFKIYIEEKFKE